MARAQSELKSHGTRNGIDTRSALALARAHAGTRANASLVREGMRHKEAPARPQLRVVERRSRIAGFRISNKVFVGYLIGFVALFGAIVMRADMAATQLKLNAMNSRLSSMQTQHERLKLELASLEAPSRIVTYAEKNLGMVYPSQVGYLGESTPRAPTAPTSAQPATQVVGTPNTLFAPAGEAGASSTTAAPSAGGSKAPTPSAAGSGSPTSSPSNSG